MTTLGFLILTGWCAALSCCDIRSRRLPNPLTVTGAAAVLIYAGLTGHFWTALRGAGLLAIPYLVMHLLWPAALGAGDVKLAVSLGAAAALGGAQSWMWSALAAPLFTAAAGIGLVVGRHTAPRLFRTIRPAGPVRARSPGSATTTVAHGPSMCAATLLGLALW
ncbi:prepilin peptidase [Nocardia sp. NPDC051750]|uniref:prepilin peptidase n=1 Tax=Nocardia sp. NPDC051750 TaxID=3364325 RepID=UPI00379E80F1